MGIAQTRRIEIPNSVWDSELHRSAYYPEPGSETTISKSSIGINHQKELVLHAWNLKYI